ncbi:hypothetical protein AZF04_10225 [Alkalihalobacillus trypoxylicola]|uniref:Bifunctional metallophosphatase/5'-nucleotidase n=1 Tax=Alkalihalobacillus trypoxylicola TaxID=519424 RepID=A0A161PZQ9_9BACI|nr:hypothetical protein AZF04_10225 [Alkalihalobacillus trypoxylicola]
MVDKKKIVILFTSDVHGKISPYNDQDKSYDGKGYSKVSSVIKDVRNQEEHVIVIDNGDMLQGTPLSHFVFTEKNPTEMVHPVISTCNRIGYDAAVIGNHEFNYGRETLEKAVNDSSFPWLSANVVKKGTEEPYFGTPYLIKEYSGVKVGILGLTTAKIPDWEPDRHIDQFDFLDPVVTAKKWVSFLKNDLSADVIIISYHGGIEKDPITGERLSASNGENQGNEMLAAIPEIDVLITGHQHLVYQGITDNQTAVIQSGTKGEFVGRVDLIVETDKTHFKMINKETNLLSTSKWEADEAITQSLVELEEEVNAWLDEELTTISNLDAMHINEPMHDIWLKEHPLVEWVNKAVMKRTGAEISSTAYFLPHGITFGQSMTRREVHTFYPFANTLVIMEVSGEDIRKALEFSATFLTLDQKGEVIINERWKKPRLLSYNYDMWEGIEYEIDLNKPEGERISGLSFKGEPVSSSKTYQIATSSYRASGTGGYDMFGEEKIIREFPFGIAELLIEELEKLETFIPEVNQNWKFINLSSN